MNPEHLVWDANRFGNRGFSEGNTKGSGSNSPPSLWPRLNLRWTIQDWCILYNKKAKAFLKPQALICLADVCIIFKTQSVHVVHSVLGNQVYGIYEASNYYKQQFWRTPSNWICSIKSGKYTQEFCSAILSALSVKYVLIIFRNKFGLGRGGTCAWQRASRGAGYKKQ